MAAHGIAAPKLQQKTDTGIKRRIEKQCAAGRLPAAKTALTQK